jgi:hypothetical protein
LLLNRQFIPIGKVQDGGLGHNMPVRLALWEAGEIWPSVVQPDALLSLGTGVVGPEEGPSTGSGLECGTGDQGLVYSAAFPLSHVQNGHPESLAGTLE